MTTPFQYLHVVILQNFTITWDKYLRRCQHAYKRNTIQWRSGQVADWDTRGLDSNPATDFLYYLPTANDCTYLQLTDCRTVVENM